jgi:hypothetical protein
VYSLPSREYELILSMDSKEVLIGRVLHQKRNGKKELQEIPQLF